MRKVVLILGVTLAFAGHVCIWLAAANSGDVKIFFRWLAGSLACTAAAAFAVSIEV